MIERARIIPVVGAIVVVIWTTSDVYDYTENDEAHHSQDFDDGENKFCFTVASDAEKIDGNNDD